MIRFLQERKKCEAVNFYNDNNPESCAWLQQLIDDGLIAPGGVSCRSITELKANDLEPYTQNHLFCGIGGWPTALDLAGYPRTRSVWSASLPCQSFSSAGKGKGFDDPRGKLWEPFLELVKVGLPQLIIGEQVAAAIGKGWLDRVFSDLEAEGYTCGAVVLGAHSLGAPHRRQRIYWVAHTKIGGLGINGGALGSGRHIEQCGAVDELANIKQSGLEGHTGHGGDCGEPGRERAEAVGSTTESGADGDWSDCSILRFRDGSQRRIKSSIATLAPGLPRGVVRSSYQGMAINADASAEARRMRLHGYGNAICLPVAVEFIRTVMSILNIEPNTP